jgi:hypothetical protein
MADGLDVRVDSAARATLSFEQHFRKGDYSDHGPKRMIVEQQNGVARIISEEMLGVRLGWDEDEYRRRFPAHGATCEVAFDPSARAWLVTLGRYDEYLEALRAAGKARHRGIDVEIVLGDEFDELDPGYWLLSGASDDEAEARSIAARTRGRVRRVHASAPKFPSVLRFAEERRVDSAPELISAFGDTLYVVNAKEAIAFTLKGDTLEQKFRVPMPSGSGPVRVAVREGHAFVLDQRGHWSLIAESGVTATRPFDPEAEGRVAVFGDHRFEIEEQELAYRFREGEVHRFPLMSSSTGVWRLGADRLVLFTNHVWGDTPNLFLFAVGQTPVRLTKVCGTVEGALTGSAHVTVGAIDLDTDREGGFEIWSDQWGFFEPSLEASPVCPEPSTDCYTHEQATIEGVARLFRRPQLELDAHAECEESCGE